MSALFMRGRYIPMDDGSVFDKWAGHGISKDLWEMRMSEGRSDTAHHNFEYIPGPPISLGQGYYLNPVRCTRCGEEREVGVSVDYLNRVERWCVPAWRRPSSWLARLFGGAA